MLTPCALFSCYPGSSLNKITECNTTLLYYNQSVWFSLLYTVQFFTSCVHYPNPWLQLDFFSNKTQQQQICNCGPAAKYPVIWSLWSQCTFYWADTFLEVFWLLSVSDTTGPQIMVLSFKRFFSNITSLWSPVKGIKQNILSN